MRHFMSKHYKKFYTWTFCVMCNNNSLTLTTATIKPVLAASFFETTANLSTIISGGYYLIERLKSASVVAFKRRHL